MRPYRGLTFWNIAENEPDGDDHMWVVLTDPCDGNPSQVLAVRLNSIKPWTRRVIVRLEPLRDHPNISKPTFANFKLCRRKTASYIQAKLENGESIQKPNMRADVLARIIRGALESGDLAMEDATYLVEREAIHARTRSSGGAA